MKRVLFLLMISAFFLPVLVHAQTATTGDRMDVLWEAADSYTPPFYKGKPLPSDEGMIRAVAISPDFNPKTTTYSWTRNGKSIPSASGLNKPSFVFKHNILNNTEDINVGLRAGGDILDASGIASIIPGTPSLVVYEKRDGFIDYTHGYTNRFDLAYAGTTLRVEPFFFSVQKGIASDIDTGFTLSGTTPNAQNIIEIPIIKPDANGSTTLASNFASKISNWQSAALRTIINF